MSDLQTDYGNLLAEFAKNSLNPNQTPDATAPVVVPDSSVPPVVAPPVTPTAPDNVADPTTPVATTPVTPAVDGSIIDDWDASAPSGVAQPAVVPATPIFDFSEVGKALGAESIKSKEDLVSFVTKVKTEAETIKTGLSDLPKELAKAIELSKQGGDYLSYLKVSSVDYGKLDPIDVYEQYVEDQSADAQGNIDYDKVNTYLDSVQDFDKELRGKEIIKSLQAQQINVVKQLEAEAVARKAQAVTSVQSVLNTITDVNGFKLKPNHKQEIFDWITSGKMMKDAFYSDSGEYDFSKVVKAAIVLKYGEKMDEYRRQQLRNGVRRELLDELQNPSITAPAVPAGAQPKTGYDLSDFIEEVKNRKY